MSKSGANSGDGIDSSSGAALLPPTDMLYMTYDGNFETKCESKVLAVSKVVEGNSDPSTKKAATPLNTVSVVLDQSVMHAQGGGQPTDIGTLRKTGDDGGSSAVLNVSKVLIDRATGVARHTGTFATGNNDNDEDQAAQPLLLEVGDTVQVCVDADARRILSECHTAGHVVDSAMARCGQFLKPTKGFHFSEGPYVEYEGSIPPEERDAVLQQLQIAFSQLVDENIDTEIALLSKQEADAVCNRQAQNFDLDVFADPRTDRIRVVTVAGYPCPCGGTHVRSTGELAANGWGILGLKSKKGVVRVRYGQSGGKKK